MVRIKFISALVLYFIPFISFTQETTGIQWTSGLSWEQVKTKAKKENKYIFLDVFATWCGPCKAMDRTVYVDDTIGNYFNSRFISVKVQMDKTKNDDKQVESWYVDAEFIGKEYKIIAFPSYLFFSPEGTMVHKETGFKPANEFLAEAKKSTMPGKVYSDPFAGYDRLVENYRKGIKDYDKLPFMVESAQKLQHNDLASAFVKDYFEYLKSVKKKKLYTKGQITFIAANINNAQNPFFDLFYAKSKKIDLIMEKKGFSRTVVDKVITTDEIKPVVEDFIKKNSLKTVNSGAKPNWDSVSQIISRKYNKAYAERTIRAEERNFFRLSGNMPAYVNTFLIQYQKNELDTTALSVDASLNELAWIIFENSNDKERINTSIKIIEGVLRRKKFYGNFPSQPTDTYANLLYKASILFGIGSVENAIEFEKKAIEYAKAGGRLELAEEFQKTVNKMSKREPTWQ